MIIRDGVLQVFGIPQLVVELCDKFDGLLVGSRADNGPVRPDSDWDVAIPPSHIEAAEAFCKASCEVDPTAASSFPGVRYKLPDVSTGATVDVFDCEWWMDKITSEYFPYRVIDLKHCVTYEVQRILRSDHELRKQEKAEKLAQQNSLIL